MRLHSDVLTPLDELRQEEGQNEAAAWDHPMLGQGEQVGWCVVGQDNCWGPQQGIFDQLYGCLQFLPGRPVQGQQGQTGDASVALTLLISELSSMPWEH